MTRYRTDYAVDHAPERLIVRDFGEGRFAAQNYARRLSNRLQTTVYVIASDDSGDLGHRSYSYGTHGGDDGLYPRA